MWKTAVTERLGIRYPLVQAPMAGGPGTAALAVAVSEAGGLGSFGGGYLAPEALRQEIRAIRAGTRRPFAINLFVDALSPVDPAQLAAAHAALHPHRAAMGLGDELPALDPPGTFEAQFAVVLEERVPIFSFTFGIPPRAMLDACRSAGILTIGTATTVAEGLALKAAGVDMVCAQGAEAGGHHGTFLGPWEQGFVGTMALVPQLVDALDRPVLAAGGIMDGRGIAAALTLGAAAAQLGTAFLRCPESGTSAPYRAALAEARDDATVITRAFSGRAARGLANRFTREMAAQNAPLAPYPAQNTLTRGLRAAAARAGDAGLLSLWAGQAAPLCRELPAGELVAALVRETEAARARG